MKLSRAEKKKTHSRSQFWFGKQLRLKPHGLLPGGAATGGEDTLSGFFFFFFFTLSSMESLSPFYGCVQFATIDLRLSLERNLFLSMGLSLPEDNILNGHLLIPYQETSSSGQNVFIPSSGAETLNKHCLFVPENWQFMHSPCQKWRRQLLFF